MTTGRVALTCLVIAAFALSGCCGMCKKKESDPTPTSGDDSTEPVSTSSYALKGTHFHFNRVPLEAVVGPAPVGLVVAAQIGRPVR